MIGTATDALAMWCRDRFPSTEATWVNEHMIEHQSDELNDYSMNLDLGREGSRPSSAIPQIIKDALEYLFLRNELRWVNLAPLVASVPPIEWKKFNKILSKEFSSAKKSKEERRNSRKINSDFEIVGKFAVTVARIGEAGTLKLTLSTPLLFIELDEIGGFKRCSWIQTST